jgi:hypothetical protein
MSILDKIKTILKLLFEQRLLRALLFSRHNGYLVDTGWIKSFLHREPLDKDGKPIPWLVYPAITFLGERLSGNMLLFEYGCGNSTVYFSQKVKKVMAVEHNKEWLKKAETRVYNNTEIIFSELDKNGKYCRTILNTGMKYNIIIIDGEDRVNCIVNCLENLTEDGIIILDDSEREEYDSGIKFLLEKGFKRLDFWGISAGVLYHKATTIFYRESNCLKI